MTKIHTYIATFANHTITRKSPHHYGAAWLVSEADGSIHAKGFARDEGLAYAAAGSSMPRLISARDARLLRSYHAELAKEHGYKSAEAWVAAKRDQTQARRDAMTIEIAILD